MVTSMSESRPPWVVAMLRERCPRCRLGRIFNGRFTMNEFCPACELRFEREQGYFFGAMYVSYGLSIPILCLIILVGHWLLPALRIEFVIGLSVLPYLFLVPAVYRYSRVIWMYFDRWASPEL
jgi:uncharacterized protein (DUF983 family)